MTGPIATETMTVDRDRPLRPITRQELDAFRHDPDSLPPERAALAEELVNLQRSSHMRAEYLKHRRKNRLAAVAAE